MNKPTLMIMLMSGALWLPACGETGPEPGAVEQTEMAEEPELETAMEEEQVSRAVADIEPKSGSELTGEAFFIEEGADQVAFGVYVEGVSPGTYAVHIHEFGDCSAEDASSAGGHWNPTNEEHGKWGVEPFHLGDIGNIEVGEDGDGTLNLTTDLWDLSEESERGMVGKSVVVHEGPDDFTTQPDGAAGARIGCGVIEWKQQT